MEILRGSWNDARYAAGPAAAACLGCLAVALLLPPAAVAEEAEEQAPAVPLEKLLVLPPGAIQGSVERYGGATRGEWQARFAELRSQLSEARAALLAAQTELGELAAESDQWQMQAPGLGNVQASGENAPLSYRLHQEIRRQREEITRAEGRLQELRVEANLAGVPRDWIEPDEADAARATSSPGG